MAKNITEIYLNCLKKITKRYRYSVRGDISDSHDRTYWRLIPYVEQNISLLDAHKADFD